MLNAESERLADAVAAGSGTLDVLLNAIKARQAEREAAEARLVELVLVSPPGILVFPRGRGQWSFGGYSFFDSLLAGRITPNQTFLMKWTNREEIDALVRSHAAYPDPGPSAWAVAPIGGGSDAGEGSQSRGQFGAPM